MSQSSHIRKQFVSAFAEACSDRAHHDLQAAWFGVLYTFVPVSILLVGLSFPESMFSPLFFLNMMLCYGMLKMITIFTLSVWSSIYTKQAILDAYDHVPGARYALAQTRRLQWSDLDHEEDWGSSHPPSLVRFV
jgi:hypothetical protein